MSDSKDLAPIEQNNAVSKTNGKMVLVCDLQTKGSEIYLPQTKPLNFGSPEYESNFLQALPEEVAPEVSSILKAKRRSFSPIRVLFILVFLALALWASYCYFPRQAVIQTDRISRENLLISFNYNAITVKASEDFAAKEYRTVIRTLEEPALEISLDEAKIKGNGQLLGLYFDAVERTADYPLEKPKKIIENIIKKDPDRLAWRLDYLILHFPECRTVGKPDPWYDRASEIKKILKDYEPEKWKNAPDYEENKDLLNLYFARLNYAYWCRLYTKNKLNKESPGVKEREVAYQITKRYTDGHKISKDFLQLQVDILQTIKDSGIGWGDWEGSIYFDGKRYWKESSFIRDSHLKEQKMKLEKMEQEE